MLCTVALLALFASVQGRAVNISNTWVLPEEGFPVFYRYFRDRISWYEADAVCQFHHANLVTVDTTAQYDAVRAYLKELDISSAVWVGLIRSNPDGDFTWTDYRGLSGEGYWSSAPDARAAPLCAAADPAADYRWEARACGGPTVASFICELPVPQWALGNEGCMVKALPALTILYLPESAAVQLTADCGLAGVKRIQCTGNVKRQDLLKDLSCAEEEEITTVTSATPSSTAWPTTADAIFTDQDITTETTTEENLTTEHEDDINQFNIDSQSSTKRNLNYKISTKPIKPNTLIRKSNIVNTDNNLILTHNNNLESNSIPKFVNTNNYLSNEQFDKIEDEKHMQHKMLHEEIARLGNLENIFTQPTDHFIPPLVMAKAKISNDMVVLSLKEKHAQQMAEQYSIKGNDELKEKKHVSEGYVTKSTTEDPKLLTTDKLISMHNFKSKENMKKDKNKTVMPKKYNEKIFDVKNKFHKIIDSKPTVFEKISASSFTQKETTDKQTVTTTLPVVSKLYEDDDSSLNLTVLLKPIPEIYEEKPFYNYSGDISRLEVIRNNTQGNDTNITFYDIGATIETKEEQYLKSSEEKLQNVMINHDSVNSTLIPKVHTTTPAVLESSTNLLSINRNTSITLLSVHNKNTVDDAITSETIAKTTVQTKTVVDSSTSINPNVVNDTTDIVDIGSTTVKLVTITTTELPVITSTLLNKNTSVQDKLINEAIAIDSTHMSEMEFNDNFNMEDTHEEFRSNKNSSDILDDYNSPLLSGANEPLRRPNRSRRPQTPPNRSKFIPFRILG